LITSKR